MLKKLMITTALSGAMIGAAFAEGTPPASSPSSPPPAAQTTPADPAMKPAAPAEKSAEMSKPAGAAKFINSQKSDQFLASNFKGTDVLGPDDKKIGDVSDILFDKNGKIEAYVVSVGGFLGHRLQARRTRTVGLHDRTWRQVEERERQAEGFAQPGRVEAGGELRAVQGAADHHRHGRRNQPAPVSSRSAAVTAVILPTCSVA